MKLNLDNTYARELDGLYVPWKPERYPAPRLVAFNEGLAIELGLDPETLRGEIPAMLGGITIPEGAEPLAQAYAGHQFGFLSPQLGDGRALLLGELLDSSGRRHDLHLKGSGRTPFSRGGDGRATLGPVLREYLLGEAMHHLGVPTTRALAAITTGEQVRRETELPGAVLGRVASSHLRVGTFEFAAVRDDREALKRLTDYALARHFAMHVVGEQPALELLLEVARVQARLIAHWLSIGFVHGVMNTDNVTISGETIDYGPCAFMEAYDPKTVFSSIDRGGRYAYGNQAKIGKWNIARLGVALAAILETYGDGSAQRTEAMLVSAIDRYDAELSDTHQRLMLQKLGLPQDSNVALVDSLLELMQASGADFTMTFRSLADGLRATVGADAVQEGPPVTEPQATRASDVTIASSPSGSEFAKWRSDWLHELRRHAIDPHQAADSMDRVNPRYIARNHQVEAALDAAHLGDFGPFERLLEVLRDPFTRRTEAEPYAAPAPASFGSYKTFCGT